MIATVDRLYNRTGSNKQKDTLAEKYKPLI